ncbi:MAG: alanine racemase [Acidobacteria bacterium]|nr:alanine racemase [Acidobacteriota bacterium]
MIRCTSARVDLDALTANFRVLQTHLADEARTNRAAGAGTPHAPGIIAVVKANAYGHGARPVARALEAAGATMLAVADIEEGVDLREAGVRAPILVFGALSVSDVDGVFAHNLTPTISSPAAARALESAALARGTRLAYHLKIDTGLNRLGFRHDNLRRTVPPLLASSALYLDAVHTHFATADEPESPAFEDQRRRFEAACHVLDELGAGPRLRHAANSAAVVRDSRVWYDFVRPGLLLYGLVPPPLHTTLALRPVMSLTSRVVAVKGVRENEAVGYGARFVAGRPTTIAVVPAGYADGLDRRLEGRGHVLVRGRRAPIVGAVSMDMLTVDVTDIEYVEPGDEVVFLGRQGDEPWQTIDAREMAAWIGTIPYEVLCRLGARVERIVEQDGESPIDPAPGPKT